MRELTLSIGRIVNRLLRPVGIRIQRYNPNAPIKRKVPLWRYENVLRELHDHLAKTALTDLPQVECRLELLGQLEGQSVTEAMFILDALHRSLEVDGDVCEFGVAAGATSALIANEIRQTSKSLWLFDSFQGLPKPTFKDKLLGDFWNLGSMEAYEGTMSFHPEVVRSRLEAISFPMSRVEIVPGFIEQTLQAEHVPERISFALIDVDFYLPVLTALNFLSDRLQVGGYIVVDDYGAFSSGAKIAVDEFVSTYPDLFTIELLPEWAGHFVTIIRR